jgi:sigma-54 dependent transcriptional regulator, acetoin dehydrogenase operon transcriptional activator AcoR
MQTILFVDSESPDKPLLAAAGIESIGNKKILARIASSSPTARHKDVIDIITKNGNSQLSSILPLEDLEPYNYDLVVSFDDQAQTLYPALPGTPAIVEWRVPDANNKKEWEKVYYRIQNLVRDLINQGYLKALIQARRNGELILDNLSEGVIAHGCDRRFFFLNKAAEKITGLKRNDVVGKDCHVIFPARFCSSHCSFCDELTNPIFPVTPYQITVRNTSGEEKYVEMSVVPIIDSSHKPTGVMATLRDISREYELQKRLGEITSFSGIIGRDSKMQDIFKTITRLAESDVPVLIQGESGTGKELVAAAIHDNGNRATNNFVTINCGALPDDLLESELFGYVKGAFTGAVKNKKGRFELADHGTIFLDEIGDISPAMQVKLLRVLQDGSYQPLGSEENQRQVDVRVIAATHKDLKSEIKAGRFREDLFYRLCVVPITLPPLRDKLADIPLLVKHFLKQAAEEENRPNLIVSQETLSVLMEYHWPGNIRELQNILRYLVIKCPTDIIEPQYLPPELKKRQIFPVQSRVKGSKKLKKASVQDAIERANGNKAKAARILGVGRATLYRFLSSSAMKDSHQKDGK